MVDSALKGLFGGGESDDKDKASAASNPLSGLFGGGGDDDDPVADREGAKDFINRVTSGKPEEGFSTQEALARLSKASKRATPEQMRRAAERATSRLDDNQRAEFGKMLQDRMGGQRSGSVGATQGGDAQGGDLAGMLGDLFSGGGGGGMGGLLGGLLGGADANTNATQGGGAGGGLDDLLGGVLGSTAGKAAVGGLAAFVLSELLGGDDK
ncbi:MAG: hypothetical protein IT336_05575 [Thermomicrobiales bacterium]|nr:hypothetical protein [Thermomicrobiales bacterium]